MIIAVLFNSNDPSFKCAYGKEIQEYIFISRILQDSTRHMKIGAGDLLFRMHSKNKYSLTDNIDKTFFSKPKTYLLIDKLCHACAESEIYVWVIQNVDEVLIKKLHSYLLGYPPYLGIHSVDFSFGHHYVLYQHCIGEKYRISGNKCSVFFSDFCDDDKPVWLVGELMSYGFDEVDFEDTGIRLTLLDEYDNPEHYRKMNEFIEMVSSHMSNFEAFELAMILNDINPEFFNILGAAIKAIKTAENEEDFAQTCLSGRRYLEQLANVLFEPRDEKYKGRNVKTADYKNRIWAFIDDNIEDKSRVKELGTIIDNLVNCFNSGIHGETSYNKISTAFTELAKITAILISFQPLYKKVNYHPYRKEIDKLFSSISDNNMVK